MFKKLNNSLSFSFTLIFILILICSTSSKASCIFNCPEDDESSSDEEDEYNSYGKDNDLKIENKIIDGICYTYYSDTKRVINKEHEYVGIWNGEYIEFANHHRERDHFRHCDYKRDTLIVGQ